MRIIDLNSWKRKEHFNFFSKMASPFLGIVTEVDCTDCYAYAKERGQSFFASYLAQVSQLVPIIQISF